MKKTIITLIVLVLVAGGLYYFFTHKSSPSLNPPEGESTTTPTQTGDQTTSMVDKTETVIGTSVEGNGIVAYHYGANSKSTSTKEILFVGGIHGGYEWNTALVAYNLMDYLKANPDTIPQNVTVTVIPVLNPDGLSKVVGTTTRFAPSDVSSSQTVQVSGRFNGNKVDLNRNFDCEWQEKGTWQNTPVSGGSEAFSEPESKAIRDYVVSHSPTAVVVWYSAGGGVYSSSCQSTVSAETKKLTTLYANASGYKGYENFDSYATTGDMTNWLAKNKIPAISILLTTHQDVEWDKNLAGVKALLGYYGK